jgi:hypothetical protein
MWSTGTPGIFRRIVPLVPVCSILLCAAGCGSGGIDTSQMKEDWESYSSEHFVFYYPPDSPRLVRMAGFVETCEEISAHLCRVLQIEPDRLVDFFVFNTDVQSDSLIGRPAGFFEGGAIFMRIGQYPGGYVARAMCYFIDRNAESFVVLKDGMHQLYAQPSVNVHSTTFGIERKNRFIPLGNLVDTTFAKDPAVYYAEAASLCAFLLANYGPDRFKMLWSSTLGFGESIERIYGARLDNFEKEWRQYYQRESGRT